MLYNISWPHIILWRPELHVRDRTLYFGEWSCMSVTVPRTMETGAACPWPYLLLWRLELHVRNRTFYFGEWSCMSITVPCTLETGAACPWRYLVLWRLELQVRDRTFNFGDRSCMSVTVPRNVETGAAWPWPYLSYCGDWSRMAVTDTGAPWPWPYLVLWRLEQHGRDRTSYCGDWSSMTVTVPRTVETGAALSSRHRLRSEWVPLAPAKQSPATLTPRPSRSGWYSVPRLMREAVTEGWEGLWR